MKGRPQAVAASAAARISSTAGLQALDLFLEGVHGILVGHGAERDEQLAGGADRAADDDLAGRRIGDFACDLGGLPVQLEHPVLGIVKLEAVAGSAEGIGQDDIRAGIDEILVQLDDTVRVRFEPHFRRLAGFEAHVEQIGAGRAVGEQDAFFSKEVGEGIGGRGHGRSPEGAFGRGRAARIVSVLLI